MIGLSPGAAWAQSAELRSETLFQARSDVMGDLYSGGIEALGGIAEHGPARLEGYGDLGFRSGFDAPFGGEVYVLTADGTAGDVGFTVGRQPLLLPTWNRRLDGGRVAFPVAGRGTVEAWAGLATQPGTAGTWGGVPVARVAGAWEQDGTRAAAGAWVEAAADPALHGDLTVRWTRPDEPSAPDIALTGAVGTRAGETRAERLRTEASVRPAPGWRATVFGEHREAIGGSELAADVLRTFAPAGVDSLGAGGGYTTRNRHRLWASGSVQRWDTGVPGAPPAPPGVGVVGEARWEPRCAADRWCVAPAWSGVWGSGGWLHRLGGAVDLPTPSVVDARLTGAWVPWQEPFQAWRASTVTGAVASVHPTPSVALEAGADLVFGEVAPNRRAWVALQVAARGGR